MTFEEWSRGKRKKRTSETSTSGTPSSNKQSFEEWTREKYSVKPTVSTKKDTDIAPVKPTTDTKGTVGNILKAVSPIAAVASMASEVKKGGYFNKGVFEDGYQKGDFIKFLLGSQGDLVENAYTGIVGMPEQMIDSVVQFFPYIAEAQYAKGGYTKEQAEAVEAVKKWTAEFVEKDLYNPEEWGKKLSPLLSPASLISHVGKKVLGVEDYDDVSVFGEKSDALAQSTGQLAVTAALQSAGIPWWLVSGSTSFGGQAETALREGATHEEATLSAAITATAEVLTEKISGGVKFGGKTLDDALTKKLARGISNKFVRSALKFGLDATGEGLEEVISQFANNFSTVLYKDESLKEILFNEEAVEGYIDSFIGGAVLGGGSSAVNIVQHKAKGIDPVTELTSSEQKVVDKVYEDALAEAEKDGKKLSSKEKSKLYDEVVESLEKGEISIDTIESVLGGETYEKYKAEADREEALQNEFNTLNKMKQGDMTGEQLDRRAELKQQLEELKSKSQRSQLKSQLNNEVMGLVKGSRLTSSYTERAKRGAAFEADLSQYDEKQQAIVKKAMESGVLNDTRRTHEFVDFVAKMCAEKGLDFEFANNERIKETGFAVEGRVVNGYRNGNTIGINIQSQNALRTVVGHEITHVLEGTELYDALQDVAIEFSKAKGDYGDRMIALRELYTGKYKSDADGDFEAKLRRELTADIVGEYLFTDSEFINRLSTEQPSLFKRIFDEIKYLCRVATAGSKEARELERVKKIFADAWKQNGKAQKNTTNEGSVEYSFGVSQIDIDNYVDAAYIKENTEDYKKYAEPSERLLNDVSGEVDLRGYAHALRDNDIRHIRNSHGEDTPEKYPVTKDDIKLIPWIVENYDKVFVKTNAKNQPGIVYVKVMPGNTIYYVEAVTKQFHNEKLLVNKQMVKTGFDEIPNLHGLIAAINKKMSSSQYLADLEQIRKAYVQDVKENYSTDSISQNLQKSSGNTEISLSAETDKTYLSAVENGDTETAQMLVDEAAKKAGYIGTYYHGSRSDFTIFSKEKGGQANSTASIGFWFTESQEGAQSWADETWYGNKEKGKVYKSYLKLKNPKVYETIDNQSEIDELYRGYEDIDKEMSLYDSIYSFDDGRYYHRERYDYDKSRRRRSGIAEWDAFKAIVSNYDADTIEYYLSQVAESYRETILNDAQKYLELIKERKKIEKQITDLRYSDAYELFKTDIYKQIGMDAEDANIGGTGRYVENKEEMLKKYVESLKSEGHDGIIIKNTSYDSVFFEGNNNQYVVFDSNQIKSAEPITYDDNGDIIPLSKRFNDGDDDIRYSLSMEGSAPTREFGQTYGEDVMLDTSDDIAPVQEDVAPTEDIGPVRDDFPSKVPQTDVAEDFIGGPVRNDIPVAPQTSSADNPQNNIVPDEGPVTITTVQERLEAKLKNATTELENLQKLRAESISRFDTKIADYQARYEAKKNKDTKVANELLRSIERLKKSRDNITAGYDKRISDVGSQIAKIEEQLQQDHSQQDKLEMSLKRIDARLERKKAALIEEFNRRKKKIEESTGDKDAFVSGKAYELYRELLNLKKGVRASKELSALLDYKPDWSELKHSLLNIKFSPARRVDENSSIESFAREIIDSVYEDSLYSVDELKAELTREIEALEAEAEKARQRARREDLGSVRKKKQGQYEQEVSELIGDTSSWQDKRLGISYQTNTLRRNLRDVVRKDDGSRDVEKADRIYEYLQGSYNRNEAELKRELKRIKRPFIDMKINKYESEYIQMLGELRYYPGTTLTRDAVDAYYEMHKDKIDTAKVEKAITESRKVYDVLIQRVNEVLKAQGMKEIPYIKGYYPHFTKDKQGLLGKLLNWKTVNNDIPTDIAGLTEMFTPVRTYQSFNKHREARETDYDFAQGFDTYVHGALDWIYHIEDIQKRRAFENVIRYRHSEVWIQNKVDEIRGNVELDADEAQELIDLLYNESQNPLGNFILDIRNSTNNLAGKKSTVDRTMEYATNRHVYSTMTNISNRVSANMVAGSISSALTNFIPITQSWGQVNPVYSLAAAKDAVRNAFRNDGMIEKSTFMTNRLLEEENLKKTGWDVVGEKIGLLMNVADRFTTEVVWRSKYLQNLQNGMSESEAINNADIFAENVMAGRSRGNMPTIFNSKNPVVKTLTAFQLEVANQYGYMFKDMPQDIGEKNISKLVSGYTKMFVGAFVYNALFSALTGRDSAFDPIGIIVDLCKDLGLGSDDEEEEETDVFGAIKNLGENVAQEIPFVGGLLGGGRVPISNALPYELSMEDLLADIEGWTTSENPETYRNRFIKEFMKPIYYAVMPMGGGQLKKTTEGLRMFDDDLPIAGSYTDSGDLRFPVEGTPKNKLQAAIFGQYANENAQLYFDEGYKPLNEKQIQEYIDLELPIADYWKYREGLAEQETVEDKFEYINGLNVSDEQKNIMINNVVDRKEPVDMSNYDDFADYEEFDFYIHNKEKYEFLESQGVSYKEYKANDSDKEFYDSAYSWYKNNPDKVAVSKVVTDSVIEYRRYSSALDEIRADKDAQGKPISGSAKAKKKEYIFGLNLEEGAKYILYRSQYPKDDTYNHELLDYILAREDVSYEDKKAILKELEFTIDSNGYISW